MNLNTPHTRSEAELFLEKTAAQVVEIVKSKGYVVRGQAVPMGAYWSVRVKDDKRLTRDTLQRQFKNSALATCGYGWDHIDGYYLTVQIRKPAK